MIWILLIIPPFLFALSNILDKHLTVGKGDESSPESLLVVGGVFNVIVALPIFIYLFAKGYDIFISPLILNGVLFTVAIWLYLHALKIGEIVSVAPWYQTISIFGLIGGFLFLNEIPSLFQIFAIFLIMFGGFAVSASKKFKINKKVVALMLISSLLITLNDIIFAYFGREINVATALFSDILGKALWGILFLFLYKVRKNIMFAIRSKMSTQSINEIIFIVGDAIFDVAKIYLPIALVQASANTQPLFVLLISLFLYKFAPRYLQEERESFHIIRIIGIFLMVVGGIFLVF
jgi:drug/metabolite transporter (DMT)-like permease